jgi:hypothetical protein
MSTLFFIAGKIAEKTGGCFCWKKKTMIEDEEEENRFMVVSKHNRGSKLILDASLQTETQEDDEEEDPVEIDIDDILEGEHGVFRSGEEEEFSSKEVYRVYYYIFLFIPLFFMLLLVKYAFEDDIWKKMAYLGSFAAIPVVYGLWKYLFFVFVKVPSKIKKLLWRRVYFMTIIGVSLYVYITRFHNSANKLYWTLDTYYQHNKPLDSSNPPIVLENAVGLENYDP